MYKWILAPSDDLGGVRSLVYVIRELCKGKLRFFAIACGYISEHLQQNNFDFLAVVSDNIVVIDKRK